MLERNKENPSRLILIVDDEKNSSQSFARFLELCGLSSITAKTIEDVDKILESEPVTQIICTSLYGEFLNVFFRWKGLGGDPAKFHLVTDLDLNPEVLEEHGIAFIPKEDFSARSGEIIYFSQSS